MAQAVSQALPPGAVRLSWCTSLETRMNPLKRITSRLWAALSTANATPKETLGVALVAGLRCRRLSNQSG